jgi:hypothetical protein
MAKRGKAGQCRLLMAENIQFGPRLQELVSDIGNLVTKIIDLRKLLFYRKQGSAGLRDPETAAKSDSRTRDPNLFPRNLKE